MEIIIIILILLVLGLYIKEFRKPKVEKPKLSEEEKEKLKELRKHFNNLMEYDYDKALRGDIKGD